MFTLPLFQLAIYGIAATVAGFALRYLWKHLKDQRVRLLDAYWRPAKVGLLVFSVWILWELFGSYMLDTTDSKTWLDALKECGPPFLESSRLNRCRLHVHSAYFFPFLLPMLLLKAAVAGMIAAFVLKIDHVVNRILTDARADTGNKKPKQTLKERIANTAKSTRDSVSNKRKKLLGFRPWKIFGRRKKDAQSAPSADQAAPMDPVVRRGIARENGKPPITPVSGSRGKKKKPPRKPVIRPAIGRIVTSVRDSVSNTGKKLVGFRPWKIFGRRKKDDRSAPSANQAAPSANQTAPSANQTAPSANQPAPSAKQAAPSANQPAPSADQTAPSTKEKKPTHENKPTPDKPEH